MEVKGKKPNFLTITWDLGTTLGKDPKEVSVVSALACI
jgi:hypothetical protein